MMLSWLCVTTWRTPARSTTMGDEYAGPSSFHVHLISPDTASKARSAPDLSPPTCAISIPLSAIGDIAVPNTGLPALNSEPSLRQICLPVSASQHVRIPPSPNVYNLPLAYSGVDFGPGPCPSAAELTLNVAAYCCFHFTLPVARSIDCSVSCYSSA